MHEGGGRRGWPGYAARPGLRLGERRWEGGSEQRQSEVAAASGHPVHRYIGGAWGEGGGVARGSARARRGAAPAARRDQRLPAAASGPGTQFVAGITRPGWKEGEGVVSRVAPAPRE